MQFPATRPKKVLPERHSIFLLLMHGSEILLEKRVSHGIWGGLWCPPQLDEMRDIDAYCAQHSAVEAKQAVGLPAFTHTFTHFKLHITPLLMQVIRKPDQVQEPGKVWLDTEEALRAAIPAPVRKLLQEVRVRRILT